MEACRDSDEPDPCLYGPDGCGSGASAWRLVGKRLCPKILQQYMSPLSPPWPPVGGRLRGVARPGNAVRFSTAGGVMQDVSLLDPID
jgi:hypothetical protein